jgi:OPA family glycerol-3-phosphate transporter-like MFS transporter
MIYPPLMRLMGDNLCQEHLVSGITYVTVAANVATVLIYAVSPVLIIWSGWRLVLLAAAGVGVLVTVAFLIGTKDANKGDSPSSAQEQKAPIGKLIMKAGLIPLFFAIIIMGVLRDGIQTWMPTYVSEVLKLDSSSSILTSVLLPIFAVISVSLAKVLYSKVRNEMRTAFMIYSIGAVCSTLLIFTFRSLPAFGVVMVALTNAAMHGSNLILISMVPAKFKKYGKISTFSGLINAFVYVGAAISTYGIAVISDKFGWLVTIICWSCLAITGTLICLLRIKKWTKFINE